MPDLRFARVGVMRPEMRAAMARRRAAATQSAPAPVQPAPMRRISEVVAQPKVATRPGAVQMTPQDQLRVVRPEMWRRIGRIRRLGPGASRESLALPVSATADFSDATIFEAAVGGGRFHLPRYRLALRKVSGKDQYAIRFEQAPEGDWIMRVTLTKAPPPGAPPEAVELPHELLVVLIYAIALAGGGGTTKELPFQEVREDADKRSVTAVLRFASPAERDQALAAVTQASGGAGLRVTRSVRVAIPAEGKTPNLFRPVTRGLDHVAEPNPLSLNAALHPYLFEGQVPKGTGPGLIAHQAKWRERFHSYWQDAVRPELFYFLPDAFRLARRAKPAPFLPMMTVRVENATGAPENTAVTLEFAAAPFVDQARIADARKQLARHLPPASGGAPAGGRPTAGGILGAALGGLLGGQAGGGQLGGALAGALDGAIGGAAAPEAGIVFEPMPVQKAALFLATTGAGLVEQPGAQIDVRAAVFHSMTMNAAQFQAVFDALMGGAVALMGGEIRLELGQGKPEVIPLDLRFDRMDGEMFTIEAARDATEPDRIAITLTNAIESAIEIRKMAAWLGVGDMEMLATLEGLALPAMLPAGQALSFALASPRPLPQGEVEPSFDFADVVAKPDPAAMWQTILDPTTSADYQRTIQVRAVSAMFEAPPDRPRDRVLAILVQFETGGTVELSAAKLEAETKIRMPLAAMILGASGPATYRYRCKVIRAGGRQEDAAWREDSFDILFPSFPDPA